MEGPDTEIPPSSNPARSLQIQVISFASPRSSIPGGWPKRPGARLTQTPRPPKTWGKPPEKVDKPPEKQGKPPTKWVNLKNRVNHKLGKPPESWDKPPEKWGKLNCIAKSHRPNMIACQLQLPNADSNLQWRNQKKVQKGEAHLHEELAQDLSKGKSELEGRGQEPQVV